MIIGVDLNDDKKAWGERFGMTHFVNPKEVGGDIVPYIVDMTKRGADQIGGADYTFDCTGNVKVMRQALECAHRGWGQSIIIGVAGAGQEISTRPFQLVTGRTWKGTAFGGARGRTDVPKIVDWYMAGKIEIDPMITHTLSLDEINRGFDLMHAGQSIRSVVVYSKSSRACDLDELPVDHNRRPICFVGARGRAFLAHLLGGIGVNERIGLPSHVRLGAEKRCRFRAEPNAASGSRPCLVVIACASLIGAALAAAASVRFSHAAGAGSPARGPGPAADDRSDAAGRLRRRQPRFR